MRRKPTPFIFRLEIPATLHCDVMIMPDEAGNTEAAKQQIRDHLEAADDLPWDVRDFTKDFDRLTITMISGPAQETLFDLTPKGDL